MSHFFQPIDESWTQRYPGLVECPTSFEASISPEHHELKRQAIFERVWPNVRRIQDMPKERNCLTRAAGGGVL